MTPAERQDLIERLLTAAGDHQCVGCDSLRAWAEELATGVDFSPGGVSVEEYCDCPGCRSIRTMIFLGREDDAAPLGNPEPNP